jgi:hypothetical protein
MVVRGETGWEIVEAVQPVRVVALDEFLDRGEGGRYEVHRLKESLSADSMKKLTKAAKEFLGVDYDPYFQWSDKQIYCSELVWKAYDRGIDTRLSEPRPVSDLDLSDPTVKALIAKRFPDGMPDAIAVSPQDLADSPLLERVAEKH